VIHNLWSTPVLRTTMPDDIREEVLTAVFSDYNLVDGSHKFGSINVLENPSLSKFKDKVITPAFDAFLDKTIDRTISSWDSHKMHGWVTGPGANYSINYHNHRGAQVSAVFYLICEENVSGGTISFTDPRMNANRGYDDAFRPWFEDLSFQPKSGDIIVFPSFLYHFVSTYQGNIRVALPVDLFLHTNK
jgi:uncharacterized protein (TIGR02466 family)